MEKLALLICSPQEKQVPRKRKWYTLLIEWIKMLFRRVVPEKEPECQLYRLVPKDGLDIYVIKMPYSIDQLGGLKKKQIELVNCFISQSLDAGQLDFCILPDKLRENCRFERCIPNPFPVELLYKPLFSIIMEEVFVKKGIKIGELDISIVHGQSEEELAGFLRMLSEQARFITIVADNKEAVEEVADQLCDENGLSIRVTSDFSSGIKKADLIVNFRDSGEMELDLKQAPGAVFVNLGALNVGKIKGENTIINGLELKLPKELGEKLGNELAGFFSSSELAGIILGNSFQAEAGKLRSFHFNDTGLQEAVRRKFSQEGYRITGVKGRRNTVKLRELKFS